MFQPPNHPAYCSCLLFHYASVNQYHKGILTLLQCTLPCSLYYLSSLFKGGSGYSELWLAYYEHCLQCRSEGRASYLNPCYLTTSYRIPNQVNIYLYGDDVFFFFILLQDFTFCSGAIVYILTKDHFRVQQWSIFTSELWILISAVQQYDPQKQAEVKIIHLSIYCIFSFCVNRTHIHLIFLQMTKKFIL